MTKDVSLKRLEGEFKNIRESKDKDKIHNAWLSPVGYNSQSLSNNGSSKLNSENKKTLKDESSNEKINLFKWEGQIFGPDKTPYANGIFKFVINIPLNKNKKSYPYIPPEMKFL